MSSIASKNYHELFNAKGLFEYVEGVLSNINAYKFVVDVIRKQAITNRGKDTFISMDFADKIIFIETHITKYKNFENSEIRKLSDVGYPRFTMIEPTLEYFKKKIDDFFNNEFDPPIDHVMELSYEPIESSPEEI